MGVNRYRGISVIIPVRNEFSQIVPTIESIAQSASKPDNLEIIIVDDASAERISAERIKVRASVGKVPIKTIRIGKRIGVPRARNRGASAARGDILVMTDAHCRFSVGWDDVVCANLREDRILAATIADQESGFRGYGCRLIVPFMGTNWNRSCEPPGTQVQVASCAGTVIPRKLFQQIGGYDRGMIIYGAAEPEFSVRAWLSGAEIVSLPQFLVYHRFKCRTKADHFLKSVRAYMIHNSLRFGFLYLSELACLQMIRHFSLKFPLQIGRALKLLQNSDVWARRSRLRRSLTRDFCWFIEHFTLRDQVGNEILQS